MLPYTEGAAAVKNMLDMSPKIVGNELGTSGSVEARLAALAKQVHEQETLAHNYTNLAHTINTVDIPEHAAIEKVIPGRGTFPSEPVDYSQLPPTSTDIPDWREFRAQNNKAASDAHDALISALNGANESRSARSAILQLMKRLGGIGPVK